MSSVSMERILSRKLNSRVTKTQHNQEYQIVVGVLVYILLTDTASVIEFIYNNVYLSKLIINT